MAEPDKNKSRTPKRYGSNGLRWYQGLQFKIGLLLLLLLALLSAGAFWSSHELVQQSLLEDSYGYEEEASARVAADLETVTADVETLASALAELAATPGIGPEALAAAAPRLLRGRPHAALVADFGIWPEPQSLQPDRERASLFWLQRKGSIEPRNDYNDGRSAPYYREKWYTPARYAREHQAFWTGVRTEPLSRQEVVTVALPIRDARGFLGTATVSMSLAALGERFQSVAQNRRGYGLLLDDAGRLLASTGGSAAQLASGSGRPTLADLAQRQSGFSGLALAVHKLDEQRRSEVLKTSLYDAAQVSALRDGSRELSRQEAEDALAGLWRAQLPDAGQRIAPLGIDLPLDPLLNTGSHATLRELVSPNWKLLRISTAQEGFAGANRLFQESLAVTLALVALALLVVLLTVRVLLIVPLQRMTRQLESSGSVDEALNLALDESARNEVGLLAHWQNERIRQLRESIDNARSARLQLSTESSERRSAQEQLARAQERTALALQSVSDAIITTDEHGVVDDMNPVAELLTGMSQREARGKRLEVVLRVQLDDSTGEQGNIAERTMARGTRYDFTDGLRLEPHGAAEREIVLRASPIRARGRLVGAVLVFHERSRREAPAQEAAPMLEQRDLLTGLPTRAACNRRLQGLIDQARVSGQQHAVICLDIDHLKRINDLGSQTAGDDVLMRVAETLAASVPVASDVYRLAADQFAVVLESVDEASALASAEGLRGGLASTRFYWESRQFSVTASFGVCCFGRDSTPLESLRRADDACVAAKRAGRNLVKAYDAGMDRGSRAVDDDSWVRCIQRGLDENLFHLRTQWIVAGSEHAAEGQAYEILVALEDDEGFWAAPAAFMPVAERHHLTPLIDRWVIRQTLRHLQSQPAVAESLAFASINLSSLTLADYGFLDFLAVELEACPHLAGKLCFELREDGLNEHPQEAVLTCDVLHRMGCQIAIDHYFGRHMSELELLRKLPVSFVKLDAQAFKNLGTDVVEQILAESTLRMVRQLRRRVIVHNIDDAKQLDTWRKLGAEYFQGYALAKPSPVIFQRPD